MPRLRLWCTAIHAVASVYYRGANPLSYDLRIVHFEPGSLTLLVAIGWLGVTTAMTYEARLPDGALEVPYGAHGKALIAICYLQV